MSSTLAPSDLKLPATRSKARLQPDNFILSGAFGLLLFAPLAFGATESWSMFILEGSVALLFALWVWRQTPGTVRDNPLFLPMALFGGIVLLQLVFGWTAYWRDTFSQALLYLAYAGLVFLVIQTLRRSAQAKTLAVVICAYGAGLAGFALLQGVSPNGKLYWIRTPRFGGWIYGPYVNHNSYAGLMEMLTPVPLVFCLTRYARGRVRTVAAAIAALMAATIFLSGSRGGMLAFFVELIVLGVFLVREQKGPRLGAAISVFILSMLLLLAWVGGSELTKRVATIGTETRQEMSGGTRWTIDKDGVRMFLHKPILGWGLGTFSTAYPQFRSFYTHFFVNEAHNDYLQFLVETGIVGFGFIVWFLALVYRNAIRKIPNWPDDINGAVTLACLLGCTGILVHSFVDFNLQVPANAAWFYVLCAIAASPLRLESRQRIRRSRAHLHDPVIAEATPSDRETEEPGSL